MTSILQFIIMSAVVIITPGPDTALTIRNTIQGGNDAGLRTVSGVVVGQLCWASAASVGLQAVFNASQHAYTVLKVCGAVYLFYLGGKSLYQAFRVGMPTSKNNVEPGIRRGGGSPFRDGIMSNLTNPKMLIFFSSLLSPFVHGAESFVLLQFLAFGLIFSMLTFIWLSFYILLIARAAAFFRRAAAQRIINSIAGFALLGFAFKVATERD